MRKIGAILLGISVVIAIFFFLKVKQFYSKVYTPTGRSVGPSAEKTAYNILLLGYGGGGHEGAYLTDTMMVLHFDLQTKKATLISLPRDLWVKIPTKSGQDFHAKINALYEMELFSGDFPDLDPKYLGTADDAALVKYLVGQVTGQFIDNYVGLDFGSFRKAIDLLGGVDIDVEKTFDDDEYPNEDIKKDDPCGKTGDELAEAEKMATTDAKLAFPCRYEKIHFNRGPTHMDGATALKYVRSRHSSQDGGDFGRAARQQRLLEAVREKVLAVSFLPKVIPLMDELQKYVRMDISPDEVKKFLIELPQAKSYGLWRLVLTDKNYLVSAFSPDKQYILIAADGTDKWDSVKKAITNAFVGIIPTPAPTTTGPVKINKQ
ncbi:LCP family protein [Candidatus Roizmanbacteria bacterium]|nr:LCP family protein [Candidatus Roizmanbacteria bacterium]